MKGTVVSEYQQGLHKGLNNFLRFGSSRLGVSSGYKAYLQDKMREMDTEVHPVKKPIVVYKTISLSDFERLEQNGFIEPAYMSTYLNKDELEICSEDELYLLMEIRVGKGIGCIFAGGLKEEVIIGRGIKLRPLKSSGLMKKLYVASNCIVEAGK